MIDGNQLADYVARRVLVALMVVAVVVGVVCFGLGYWWGC